MPLYHHHYWLKELRRVAPELDERSKVEQFIEMMFHLLRGDSESARKLPVFSKDSESRMDAFVSAMRLLGDEMERHRFEDLLGDAHQDLRGARSQSSTGSFYTPQNVSDLMAACTEGGSAKAKLERGEIVTVADEAVGSGRTLMSFAKLYPDRLEQLRFYATDIEKSAVMMCYVNCALNGMALCIRHGNSISNETWGDVFYTPEWVAYAPAARNAEMLKILRRVLKLGTRREGETEEEERKEGQQLEQLEQLEFDFKL